MSNKGVIRKSPAGKDAARTSRTKSSTKTTTSNDDAEKGEPSRAKRSSTLESKTETERRPRLAQSSTKAQLIKTGPRESSNVPRKPSRESSKPTGTTKLTARTPASRNPRTTSESVRQPAGAGVNKNTVSKAKPKERVASNPEKRGLSTIYVPPSLTSRLSKKPTDKNARKSERETKPSGSKEEGKARAGQRERKLSRTLSPSEVKMLHSRTGRSSSSQRVVGRKSPKSNSQKGSAKEIDEKGDAKNVADNGDDYEDDFEDYESDFQECTSESSQVTEESSSSSSSAVDPIELRTEQMRKTVNSAERHKAEEEQMHDSGHYELAEARRRAARIESITARSSKSPPLLELTEPVNKSYSDDRPSENKSLLSSTDEGFEDTRSGDFAKSPPMSQISFIEFRKAKDNRAAKKPKRVLSRGEQLLQMIKLDTMEWSLWECTPIPYDEFIRTYGRLNSEQMSTQTGEDDLEVEMQTDEIPLKNKWTQFPITCRANLHTIEDVDLFKMEQLGVGDDSEMINLNQKPTFDVLRLCEFVSRAGRLMLSLLEERKSGGNIFQKDERNISFSDGVVTLSVNSVPFLIDRPITIIHCSESASRVLLTVHSPNEEGIETTSKEDYITDCCIGCVWNVFEPSAPIKLFYSHCPITACSFHSTNCNVVLAGLQDGSICLWDLREDEMWHQRIRDTANNLDWTIRTVTYTTAMNTEMETHKSEIVAIKVLSKIEDKSYDKRKFVPIQICSLDEDGCLFVWSVLRKMGQHNEDLGLSYWGTVRLIKSQEISLSTTYNKNATCIDLRVDRVNNNSIYVATETSSVLHATYLGNKAYPACYENYSINPSGNVTCLEICPFENSLFLVGCDDGTIRLHSMNTERPILQVKDEYSESGIKAICWSKSKPFIIYALKTDSRISVWDLSNSDIDPSYNIEMESYGSVTSLDLSCCKTKNDTALQYLALATEAGKIEVHKLNATFSSLKKEDYLQELNAFTQYIEML